MKLVYNLYQIIQINRTPIDNSHKKMEDRQLKINKLPLDEPTADIYKSACPSRHLLNRIGDKWSLMVILHLNQSPLRFGMIKRACEGVSQKMLTHTLKQLEANLVHTRTVLQEKPLQVEYALTPTGRPLAQLLTPLVGWVHHHYPYIKN